MTTDVLWEAPALCLAIGYLLGSIPFGVLLTRMAGAGDLRSVGSGNIGATNVLRTGRKGLAAATLLLDLVKGAAAVWIALAIAPQHAPLAAAGAVIGHCYPVWLRFAGGKGVATYMGVALGLDWRVGLVFALLWIGGIAASRISAVGGLVATLGAPVAAWALGRGELVPTLAVLALLIWWRHRANLDRLRRGVEPRIGAKA